MNTSSITLRRFHFDREDEKAAFAALLTGRRDAASADVRASVEDIIAQVRRDGDAALCELTQRFDRLELTPETLRLSDAQCEAIAAQCPPETLSALRFAAGRIEEFHRRQMPQGFDYRDEYGNRLGMRWSAVDAAGIYVPGGTASYPSSVLMNAIPARVAGVERLAMTVPTPDGQINPAIIVAARLAGITEIYRIGGAQAVAALAYGTPSIAAVNVITGPGNAYVAEAKRQVYGVVGIDMIAGPSEIAVVADGSAPASWVAADLLSQAEHDTLAQSVLITSNIAYAGEVEAELARLLDVLPRRDIARTSLERYGAVVIVPDAMAAAEVVNLMAPEHVELVIEDPAAIAGHIRHAGAIFYGAHTPEAIGDYVAGSSHVLPTALSAAHASGLSVYHFMKKISLVECTQSGFGALAQPAAVLADCEGLGAHALSVRIRGEEAHLMPFFPEVAE